MKTIALIPHMERRVACELARKLADQLRALNVEVRVPADEAKAMSRQDLAWVDSEIARGLDLAISVGGDGTMLRAVSLVQGIPVLGINLGALGFLTEVEPEDAVPAVIRLARGEYDVEERMMIQAVVNPGNSEIATGYQALNEISIEKQDSQRLIMLELKINGEKITSFRADGILVATPTGSTAYSFSLRGPIVTPTMQCMSVVPIAPHGLFDRSLVLAPWEEVDVRVIGDRDAAVAVDGRRKMILNDGCVVRVTKGAEPARFVRLTPHRFHYVLSRKFGLDP